MIYRPRPKMVMRIGRKHVMIERYSKSPYIKILSFEGQAAVGSYLMNTNSNFRLLGSHRIISEVTNSHPKSDNDIEFSMG